MGRIAAFLARARAIVVSPAATKNLFAGKRDVFACLQGGMRRRDADRARDGDHDQIGVRQRGDLAHSFDAAQNPPCSLSPCSERAPSVPPTRSALPMDTQGT